MKFINTGIFRCLCCYWEWQKDKLVNGYCPKCNGAVMEIELLVDESNERGGLKDAGEYIGTGNNRKNPARAHKERRMKMDATNLVFYMIKNGKNEGYFKIEWSSQGSCFSFHCGDSPHNLTYWANKLKCDSIHISEQ